MSLSAPSYIYACPRCHRYLTLQSENALCASCGKAYPRHPDGFFDLRLDQSAYLDYMAASDENYARYLRDAAPVEAAGSKHMIDNYLAPMLDTLGVKGGSVLSVGCGGGWDVEALQAHGLTAYGIDTGSRARLWKDRPCCAYLSLADGLSVPFADGEFDLVFAEGVIEHVGYAGDSPRQLPDWQERQRRFMAELLRVTRPGGYILVSCPNRLFPVDFFHGGRPMFGVPVRFHSPGEQFLLSYDDIKRLAGPGVARIRPLALKRFFNLPRLAGGNGFAAALIRGLEAASGLLPDAFWRSPFSPYVVVLVQK